MARYIGPVCRQCRREGMKLFLKGERCHSREVRHRKAQLRSRDSMARTASRRLSAMACSCAKSRRFAESMACWKPSSAAAYEKAAHAKGITGENLMSGPGAPSRQRHLSHGFRHQPRPGPPDRAPRTHRRQRPQVQHSVRPGQSRRCGLGARKPARTIPRFWPSRDATAHAPAPNWIDVDREGLKGRITGLPQRSDLVQIQLNEQLIVELYSK